MNQTSNMNRLLHKSKLYLKRSSPTILTCVGVIGVVVTTVMAVKATPKAIELIKADSRLSHDGDPDAYTKLEAVRSCWQCYIPTALIGLSTISCILGANVLNKRNQASLTSAYALLNQSYQRYRKAANAVYGEDADSKIRMEAAKDTYIYADGYTLYDAEADQASVKTLFYDMFSRRYFTSTMPAVIQAQYHLNRNFILRGGASVNEFYEFLGIAKVKGGDDIGWGDELLESGIMWIDFKNDRTIIDDGMECCVISTLLEPTAWYLFRNPQNLQPLL